MANIKFHQNNKNEQKKTENELDPISAYQQQRWAEMREHNKRKTINDTRQVQ